MVDLTEEEQIQIAMAVSMDKNPIEVIEIDDDSGSSDPIQGNYI